MLGLDLAGLEIDVGESIQLGHYDIDVVAADSVGKGGDTLAVVGTGSESEFAGLALDFDGVEKGFEHFHTPGISEHHHDVGKVLRPHVDVECRTIGIDDEF